MNAELLDPGSYGGTYKRIGGEISLDFVNTISWPDTDTEHDWMNPATNFIKWSVAAGVLTSANSVKWMKIAKSSESEMLVIRSIRKKIRDVLAPLAFGKKPLEIKIIEFDALVRTMGKTRKIDPKTMKWTWMPPETLANLLAPVIWNAQHILTETDHTRLKHCSSCNWLFYDSSKGRRRKWCDMNDCGSRDKSLRYYYNSKKEVK